MIYVCLCSTTSKPPHQSHLSALPAVPWPLQLPPSPGAGATVHLHLRIPCFIRVDSYGQWLFLVPLTGGRWHIIPQLAVYTTYIPLIYCLKTRSRVAHLDCILFFFGPGDVSEISQFDQPVATFSHCSFGSVLGVPFKRTQGLDRIGKFFPVNHLERYFNAQNGKGYDVCSSW